MEKDIVAMLSMSVVGLLAVLPTLLIAFVLRGSKSEPKNSEPPSRVKQRKTLSALSVQWSLKMPKKWVLKKEASSSLDESQTSSSLLSH